MELEFELSEKNISELELTEVEKEIKLLFPRSYKSFILKNNGGIPNKEYFEEEVINWFLPIKYGSRTLENTMKRLLKVIPDGFVPIADVEGGWPICINLKIGNNYGYIYLVPMDGSEIKLLTKSFKEFLNGLSEEYI